MLETLGIVIGPTITAAGAVLVAWIKTNRALKEFQKAKEACNDKVHALEDKITFLEGEIVILQTRCLALERALGEYDAR